MKLFKTFQVNIEEMSGVAIDAFISASGFESRAPYAASIMTPRLECSRRIALGFADRKVGSRVRNDRTFATLGFEIEEDILSDDGNRVGAVVSDCLVRSERAETSIVLDYSCMTKTWYAEVIRLLFSTDLVDRTVHFYFVYSPAKFVRPDRPG